MMWSQTETEKHQAKRLLFIANTYYRNNTNGIPMRFGQRAAGGKEPE